MIAAPNKKAIGKVTPSAMELGLIGLLSADIETNNESDRSHFLSNVNDVE